MRFQLDIDRRNISNQRLLDDLVRIARELKTASPTSSQYRKHGCFDTSTLIRRFGGWRGALQAAGLSVERNNGGLNPTELIADLQQVAKMLQRCSVTVAEYERSGRFSTGPFSRVFGSWNAALRAAGLEITKRSHVTDEELFENLEEIWNALGRQPRYSEIERPLSKFSAGTYEARFGSWRKSLEAFVSVANSPDDSTVGRETLAPDADEPCRMGNIRRRRTPRSVNWRLRFLVMQRDGFRCRICGASPAVTAGVRLHVDHVLAWSSGGETVHDNLQTLCEKCNIGKSNLPDDVVVGA